MAKDPVIANPYEVQNQDKTLWLFSFGAYGWTQVFVWEKHLEDAFEVAVEWLDEHAPGHLVSIDVSDLQEAAKDLGIEWQEDWPDWEDRAFEKVAEHAVVDLTSIGHTTLKHGQYLRSWEWHVNEVHDDLLNDVRKTSWSLVYDDDVRGPGKFEGEEPYVPYLFQEATPDEEDNYPDGGGWVGIYEISSEDRERFHFGKKQKIALVEESNGFVREVSIPEARAILATLEKIYAE